MNAVYNIAGVSKQSVHQHNKRHVIFESRVHNMLLEVDLLRSEHPGCGVEKMYYTLQPDWLGRDRFIELFMDLGYRVRKHKNYIRTTIPAHFKYPNLIQGMEVIMKNQLWQTDTTYIKVGRQYYYLVFILDVYTRRILGYSVSDHMRTGANIKALRMAMKNCGGSIRGLIHHSDRGSQYIDKDYTAILKNNGAHISMGEKAQDNAYAERINGIIKNEYLAYKDIKSFNGLKVEVKKAVDHYNTKRIHSSLPGKVSPIVFEKSLVGLYRTKRPTVIVYADGNSKIKESSNHLDFMTDKESLAHYCPIVINRDCLMKTVNLN
jgi:transposase InsO family protein